MDLSGLTGSGLLTSKVERLFPDPGTFPWAAKQLSRAKKSGISGSNRLGIQGINFLKYGLKSLFQLFLGARLPFRSCKLPVVGNGASVKIGGFYQQFGLGIILCGHCLIL
jgi:hypothetical protein